MKKGELSDRPLDPLILDFSELMVVAISSAAYMAYQRGQARVKGVGNRRMSVSLFFCFVSLLLCLCWVLIRLEVVLFGLALFCLFGCLSVCVFVCFFVCLFLCLCCFDSFGSCFGFVWLFVLFCFVWLVVCLCVCLFFCLFVVFSPHVGGSPNTAGHHNFI